MQPGIFWIQDKAEPDLTYAVSFGDTTSLPSCVCIDWLKYKLPCQHMVTIFNNFRGWSWDMLCSMYTGNPMLNLDFSCFDKTKEDLLLASLKVDGCMETAKILTETKNKFLTMNRSSESLTPPVPIASALKATMNSVNASMASASASLSARNINNKAPAVPQENFHFITNLATDCDTFCQELSSTIHQVDNRNMLQKVKLDLQLMLNDVKLEISKLPSTTRSTKRLSESANNLDNTKKSKLDMFNMDDIQLINVPAVTGLTDNLAPAASSSVLTDSGPGGFLLTSNHLEQKISKLEDISGISSNDQQKVTNDSAVDDDVWIFDAELDIRLYKLDQKHILNGEHLSLSVIRSVQSVLRHQFEEVSGLCDPERLAELSDDIQRSEKKEKVLQLHMADGYHWSASSRIAENNYIFCCTLSSKAKVIEQILKMTAENCMGDNILFIERMEKDEEISNCGLYAIAYTVAIAFDIEPRNLVFDETEMRSHLSECLEDMCFSMFPLKTS